MNNQITTQHTGGIGGVTGSGIVTFQKYETKGEAMNQDKLAEEVKHLNETIDYLVRDVSNLERDMQTILNVLERAGILEHSFDSVNFRSSFSGINYKIKPVKGTDA